MRKYLIGLGILAVAVIGWMALQPTSQEPVAENTAAGAPEKGAPIVQVKLTELSGEAVIGERVFNAKCATCHGENAAGQEGVAPPLIHKIYEPSHHGDQAFYMAAQNGVRAHHWPFGSMPPVEGVTRADVKAVVTYIRTLQRENGIY